MCSFFDAKPGGRQDVELKQLYDAVIAPPRQKSSGTADTINLKFTAHHQGLWQGALLSGQVRLPTALRRARVRHYARSYVPCKGDP